MASAEVLLIDLGGVLVRDPRPTMVRALAAGRRSKAGAIRDEYYRLSVDLDLGRIDLPTMYRRLRSHHDLLLSYPRFRHLVTDRSLVAYRPVLAELRRLRRSTGIRVVVVSNTSEAVWHGVSRKFGIDRLADTAVLSFREGVAKPDPRYFRVVRTAIGTKPSDSLFVDDSWPNVRAARAAGFRAQRTRGPAETVRLLRRLRADERPPSGPKRAGRPTGIKRLAHA